MHGLRRFFLPAGFALASIIVSINAVSADDTAIAAPSGTLFKYTLVAHALGGIDNRKYLNDWPAFEASYKKGFRVFEVDLELTKDKVLVCIHNHFDQYKSLGITKPIELIDYDDFVKLRYDGVLPVLGAEEFFKKLTDYPDVFIITDTKGELEPVLTKVVEIGRLVNPQLLERIVPQIYNGSAELSVAQKIYPFKNIFYSLYKSRVTDEQVLDFVRAHHVDAVVFGAGGRQAGFVSALKDLKIRSYAHAVNDWASAEALLDIGVDGIYTDFLAPTDGLADRRKTPRP